MKLNLNFNLYQDYLEIKSQLFFNKIKKCEVQQKKLLDEIVQTNKNTHFGKLNNFSKIKSYNSYKQIPIHTYDDLKNEIDKEKKGITNSIINNTINYFAITSGTTNYPKFLPHTKSFLKKRKLAWEIWSHELYKEKPKALSPFGSILSMNSKPYEGFVYSHQKYGSISGKIHDMQPHILKSIYAIPDEVFLIEDFKLKYYLTVLFSLKRNITFIITPNPSTILILKKTLKNQIDNIIRDLKNNSLPQLEEYEDIDEKVKNKIIKLFQKNHTQNNELSKKISKLKKNNNIEPKLIYTILQVICCWLGGNVKIYLKEIRKSFGENITIRDPGYISSEGRFSIPIKTKENGEGVLDITSNFFEFIKIKDYNNTSKKKPNPKTYLAHELEKNEKYFILITNENGLYRYDINDIIQVTGFFENSKTPLIIFIQKGKYFSSITGEKISEWEITNTIKNLEKQEDLHIKTYFTIPNINPINPNYNYYIEFNKTPTQIQIKKYEKILDLELQSENIEYKEKRESKRLNSIKIILLPKHSVENIKLVFGKGKTNESQVKEPKLIVLDKDIKIIKEFIKKYKIK
jgi:hypothetical protein